LSSDKVDLDLRQRVAAANRVMGYWYNVLGIGHTLMHLGHVSAKLPGKSLFFVKGRPLINDLMIKTTILNVVTVDFDGKKVEGASDVTIPSEIQLHSYIYRARPDVGAICHAHPHFTILSSDLKIPLKPMCNGGLDVFPIMMYWDNALISTDEHGQGLVKALGKASTCLLRGHGAVTVADTPENAMLKMMYLENQAKLNVYAYMTVGKDYQGIPEEQVQRYISDLAKRAQLAERRARTTEQNLWEYLIEQANK
jgi:ribulose-5-phosphate 4-epimerase/fuculose-1-phosphate aldolase